MNLKNQIAIISFFILSRSVTGQGPVTTIIGVVTDKSSRVAIEFASVELLNATDSILIKGTVTDNKEKFALEKVKRGHYLFSYSFIGYEKSTISIVAR